MKNKLIKKIISLILCFCFILSYMCIGANTQTITGSLTSFGINRLYSSGLLYAGKVINNIAQSTNVETLESIGSFVYIWVCGGNNNADDIAAVNALCQEILKEVQQIETKLDSYSSTLAQMQSNSDLKTLITNMNTSFTSDVESAFGNLSNPTSLSHAFLSYFNSDDIKKLSSDNVTISKEEASYLVSCYMHKNNIADKYGNYFTIEEINNKRTALIYQFCAMRGIKPTEYASEKDLLDALFSNSSSTNPDVDTTIRAALEVLSANLVKDNNSSYADWCAQVAYAAFPSLTDQYEFVMNSINKQFMTICLTEMLYQEYLDIRGEYLETYHKDNTDMWKKYNEDIRGTENGTYKGFDYLNRVALSEMENRLNTELKVDTALFIEIDDYVKYEDTEGVVIYDKSYNNWTLVDEISMMYMPADMLSTFTRTGGVEIYYMLSGDSTGDHNTFPLSCLVDFEEGFLGIDDYTLTSEVRNFMQNAYTDSCNTYECIVTTHDVESLFNSPSFALYSSSPYTYLSNYYSDDDISYNKTYLLLDYIDRADDGTATDTRDIFKGIDMKGNYVGFDPNAVITYLLDGKSICEKGYTSKDNVSGFAKNADVYGAGFSVILYNTGDTFKKKLSYSVDNSASIYITDKDGDIISSGSQVTAGENLTLHMKAKDTSTILSSLTLDRHNNIESPDAVTNTQNILDRYDFETLTVDLDGYYTLDFSMPYSDATFNLHTEQGYTVSISSNEINPIINLYKLKELFTEGESVSVNCTSADKIVITYGETVETIDVIDNIASFAMPSSNVTLTTSKETHTTPTEATQATQIPSETQAPQKHSTTEDNAVNSNSTAVKTGATVNTLTYLFALLTAMISLLIIKKRKQIK